ncbi:hypothetical protein [Phytohabitans flavus]|uniref:hypothetical protein n=1 Tax=Phytohabitans flavus TaxID=1076124 RepID=UPI001E5B2E97|nr:hypothetical protein [Phytohabitans flavus]
MAVPAASLRRASCTKPYPNINANTGYARLSTKATRKKLMTRWNPYGAPSRPGWPAKAKFAALARAMNSSIPPRARSGASAR